MIINMIIIIINIISKIMMVNKKETWLMSRLWISRPRSRAPEGSLIRNTYWDH